MEATMSRKKVQEAVLAELRRSPTPVGVRDLVERIRRGQPALGAVSDFDVRAAVLAMMAIGAIDSTLSNRLSARADWSADSWTTAARS